uniref:transposase n=1 Tax=Paenibacillus durus TaxID=44251 RepID=UPI000693EB61|nr:transposase [Paenibacillus durus]
MQETPVSTVQRMHQEAIPTENERLTKQARNEAKDTTGLVLGIDDFAIKKGHTYNMGIHNLRGETMLDLLAGRKLEDLRAYARQHPDFLTLKPKAVVIDLATRGSANVFMIIEIFGIIYNHVGALWFILTIDIFRKRSREMDWGSKTWELEDNVYAPKRKVIQFYSLYRKLFCRTIHIVS